MIFYTNWLPARFDGFTIGPLSLIRPAFRDDAGLQAHEAVHRAQFVGNPLMGLLYLFSARHRLAAEAAAYHAQLIHQPEALDKFAQLLATDYRLDITRQQAKEAILAATFP